MKDQSINIHGAGLMFGEPARGGAGFLRVSNGDGVFCSSSSIQTSLIQNAHGDLVTDAAYDFYGVRLATCSLDHRIKIWQLDESDGTWTAVAEWKVRVSFA